MKESQYSPVSECEMLFITIFAAFWQSTTPYAFAAVVVFQTN